MDYAFSSDPGITIEPGKLLSTATTFQLGGPCRSLLTCRDPEQLAWVVKELAGAHVDFVLIGGGSNILVSDQGVDTTVVRYVSPELDVRMNGGTLEVGAGCVLDQLAVYCAVEGWEGLMCCTGIPGTVGGAIVGNAGAWGRQVSDVLESVELMDCQGRVREEKADSLAFRYRGSRLQQERDVVVSARFRLSRGDPGALAKERDEILRIRAEKHPDLQIDPCIGSFFRNIEPSSAVGRRQAAGWFLEQAGVKSLRVGGARVFEKHANIIIKSESCTAQDVFDLADQMAAAVKEKFDFDLVREIRYLGAFKGESSAPATRFY